MLRILGKASSINVRKVLWTCAELDIPFEREDWGSGFKSPNTPEFLALNPCAMVPVIQTAISLSGNPTQSFVIWRRVTAAPICIPLSLLPGRRSISGSTGRPRAESLVVIPADGTGAQVARLSGRRCPAAGCRDWMRNMEILDRQLEKTGAYVSGEQFSTADISIGLSVNRWFETPLDHGNLAAVSAYYDRLNQRDGYRLYGRNGTP